VLPRLCADVTGDGYVTATDGLATLTLAVEGEYAGEADVVPQSQSETEPNAQPDGKVTATDALVVLTASVFGSIPDCASNDMGRAIVSSASCGFTTGGIADISLSDLAVVGHRIGATDADAVVRVIGDRIFAINRFDGSSVQEIDPNAGLATLWRCSVGAGSNPHDFVLATPTKGYVTRYDATSLVIVDPSVGPDCEDFVVGSIDLSSYADADGLPEMDQMVLVGDRLFVSIQRLDRDDFFRPGANGALVVLDTRTDTVTDVVELAISNPFVETKGLSYDERSSRIWVGGPGTLFSDLDDGGIEAVDAVTLESLGVLLDGGDLGGDLLDFVIVGSSRAFAIVADESFVARVVDVNLETGQLSAPLLSSSQNVSDIELTADGKLWVVDRNCFDPGLRVFAIGSGDEITAEPIYPGLTPFTIDFVADAVAVSAAR
jgi:hypothetical protein